MEAGIAKGEVVHVDATLIRADAGWENLVFCHAEAVASENGGAENAETGLGRPAPRSKTPLRPALRYTSEFSEGRVVQRPHNHLILLCPFQLVAFGQYL